MKTGPSTTAKKLFEVNLIAQQVHRLRRRVLFQRCAVVATLIMLALTGLEGVNLLAHLTRAVRLKFGLARVAAELAREQRTLEELNQRRQAVAQAVSRVSCLVPIAKARVAWGPKLIALAQGLPRGTGISSVNATVGDLFDKRAGRSRRAAQGKDKKVPSMTFYVVYLPAAGDTEDPMGALHDALKRSADFMHKMELVRLEEAEEGQWEGQSVIFFRGYLRGEAAPDET